MRNIQWGYIQILIMNKKYELAEQEIQERLKNYIVLITVMGDGLGQPILVWRLETTACFVHFYG